jgi:hypothetical protein
MIHEKEKPAMMIHSKLICFLTSKIIDQKPSIFWAFYERVKMDSQIPFQVPCESNMMD